MNMTFEEYMRDLEARKGPLNTALPDAISGFYNNQVVPTGKAILENVNAPPTLQQQMPSATGLLAAGGSGQMPDDAYTRAAKAADPALLTMRPDGTQPPRLTIPQTNRAAGTTDQQRKMTPFSLTPPTPPANNRIGTNEMLMRVGGAMMGGAAEGGLNAMDKGLAAYGQIQDANRTSDAAQYATELDQYNKGMAALLKAQKKGKGNNPAAMLGSIVVNDAIGRAIPLISNFSAGVGSYLKILPATDAKNLERLLDAVKANAGFDKLQDMRDNSPTGGALGQVSNLELNFLQSVFGNLDQDQSPAQLRYNLQMFQWVYNTLIHGFDNHPYKPPAGSEATVGQLRSIMQAGAASGAQAAPAQQGYDYSAADAIVGN